MLIAAPGEQKDLFCGVFIFDRSMAAAFLQFFPSLARMSIVRLDRDIAGRDGQEEC